MAIVEFVNQRNRTYAGMRAVINYVLRPDKTTNALTTGINLNPANAFDEMVTLKQLMGKTDKRLWYHFIQSFPPYDTVTPELALQVALETAAYFKDKYQMLIAVHTDKNHIHTHFVMNTVNIETGRKYTQNNEQRIAIQALSDRICEKYGLHVLSESQKNNGNYKKPGQYRAEQKGFGWKAKLKAAVDDVLSRSVSREDFIRRMEKRGYQVKWTDMRENITFTTPTGMKCRDRRLGEPEYYNKHNFEMVFELNARVSGGDEYTAAPSVQPLLQDLAVMFGGADWQTIFDGFMLREVDFEGMTWREVEDTIARLRYEAETRKARALANQTEVERRAAQQAFAQAIALLEELERRVLESIALSSQGQYEVLFDNSDEVLEI